MRISTLDPSSMSDVLDLDTPMHGAENSSALDKIFNDAADSSITGSIH